MLTLDDEKTILRLDRFRNGKQTNPTRKKLIFSGIWRLGRFLPFIVDFESDIFSKKNTFRKVKQYCCWKKSCTTWDAQDLGLQWDVYHINIYQLMSFSRISEASSVSSPTLEGLTAPVAVESLRLQSRPEAGVGDL